MFDVTNSSYIIINICIDADPHNQLSEHHAEGARPGSTAIDRSSQEIGRMVLNLLGRSLQEP